MGDVFGLWFFCDLGFLEFFSNLGRFFFKLVVYLNLDFGGIWDFLVWILGDFGVLDFGGVFCIFRFFRLGFFTLGLFWLFFCLYFGAFWTGF